MTRPRSIVKSAAGDLDSTKSLQYAKNNTTIQNESVTINESNVDITSTMGSNTNTQNVSAASPPKSYRTELKEKASISSTTIPSSI